MWSTRRTWQCIWQVTRGHQVSRVNDNRAPFMTSATQSTRFLFAGGDQHCKGAEVTRGDKF